MLTTRLLSHRYVPATAPGAHERVMVVLHGLGDSLNGFSFLPQALRLPEFSYLMVNAPDDYYGGFSWYDFGGQGNPVSHAGIRRSRGLLMGLIEELEAQGVTADHIYFFGFSQGCLMATDVGLRCPKVLGGICGVSGYVGLPEEYPEQFSAVARQQKFLITHGVSDPMVPFGPAAQQFAELQKLGIPLDFRIYEKVHTLLPEELDEIREWFAGLIQVDSHP
jgi:phospholipase/carboxylesterase